MVLEILKMGDNVDIMASNIFLLQSLFRFLIGQILPKTSMARYRKFRFTKFNRKLAGNSTA